MNGLREAAQAVIEQWDAPNWKLVVHTGVLIDRLRAALAQPEVPRYVGDARKHVICICPDCVATNYRGWRETVHDELVTTWTFSAENKDDPRKALQDIINWHVRVALDPAVSSDAQALIERGKAMRDVTPPTESTIAAKCQRIEGSGEICGLTPPCPDCGSSLIDVPEGSL